MHNFHKQHNYKSETISAATIASKFFSQNEQKSFLSLVYFGRKTSWTVYGSKTQDAPATITQYYILKMNDSFLPVAITF